MDTSEGQDSGKLSSLKLLNEEKEILMEKKKPSWKHTAMTVTTKKLDIVYSNVNAIFRTADPPEAG